MASIIKLTKLILKCYSLLIILILVSFLKGPESYAQTPTIGLLVKKPEVTDGYTLFTPESNQNVYLINNCGKKVNEWVFSEKPGATCYLLDNGHLLRAGKDSLEIRDWDSKLIWSYAMNDNGLLQHHDIEPLPNGNILCVLTDRYTDAEIISEGRDPATTDETFKLDKIIELQPTGTNDANIVWEWKFIDHFIQDFDLTKPNFGVVEDHPELIDLNFMNNFNQDYTHVNAIDYNPVLDQIILTVRHLSEIFIIDHSTTTFESSGHTGGNFNRGGDILWRWGNPQVYKQGGIEDQKLFLPHDAKWVDSGYLDEDKITVFNNDGDGTSSFSSIHLINPEIVNDTYTKEEGKFYPIDFEWSWSGSLLGEIVYQGKKSGTHSLPNGNFIICEFSTGKISEINKAGDHLWTYINPSGKEVFNQFDIPVANGLFRAEKYPSNYVGFTGKDLSSQGIIENQNDNSETCILIDDGDGTNYEIASIVNPVANGTIEFNKNIRLKAISIIDVCGRSVYEHGSFIGNQLEINLTPAIYFLQLHFNTKTKLRKIIVL